MLFLEQLGSLSGSKTKEKLTTPNKDFLQGFVLVLSLGEIYQINLFDKLQFLGRIISLTKGYQ